MPSNFSVFHNLETVHNPTRERGTTFSEKHAILSLAYASGYGTNELRNFKERQGGRWRFIACPAASLTLRGCEFFEPNTVGREQAPRSSGNLNDQ